MKRIALLVLAAPLVQGCVPDGPLGTVGAIVAAPTTALVMFVSARMNGGEAHLERARRNDRPLPPIDPNSSAMAQATLERALERGRSEEDLHRQNNHDARSYTAGGVTVLATTSMDDA